MKNYLRLLSRTTNTPLFIAESKLSVITENVLLPLFAGLAPSLLYDAGNKVEMREQAMTGSSNKITTQDIAVINIFDTLAAKGSAGMSGGTTYEGIRSDINAAVTNGYTSIMLYIDSPGGEATGLFALTDYIRNLQTKGIYVFSYVDGMATSAAYAIAASSQTIYATNTSLLGSIGAIMVHLETSKADIAAGKTYTIFRSKSEKALGDSHTALTEQVIAKFNLLLDNMDTAFNNDILQSRPNLTLADIISTRASEFIASDALSLGLVDSIVSGMDSTLTMAMTAKNKKPSATALTLTSNSSKGVNMDIEELQLALTAANASNAQLKVEALNATTLALTAERERVSAILTASTTLKTSMDTVVRHIHKGYSVEDSLEIQTDIATGKGTITALNTENNSSEIDPDLDAKLSAQSDSEAAASVVRLSALRAGARAAGLKFKTTLNAGV